MPEADFLTVRQFYDHLSCFSPDATTNMDPHPQKVDYDCGGHRGVKFSEDWNVIELDRGTKKVAQILDALAPYVETHGKCPMTYNLDVITNFSTNSVIKHDFNRGKDVHCISSLNPYYEPPRFESEPKLKAIVVQKTSDKFLETWCEEEKIRSPFQFYFVGENCYTATELKQEFTDLAKESDWVKLFDSRQVGPVTIFECKFSARCMYSEFRPKTKVEKLLQELH